MSGHPVRNHLSNIDRLLTLISNRTRLNKHQILLLSIFPFIIAIGQLMSKFSPDEMIHNYFTSKGNILNTYFVKFGWFWTIISYLNIIFNKIRHGTVSRKIIIISIIKVSLITLCWMFFTQWFFGPPLMDRIFVLTGGQCNNVHESKIPKKIKHLFNPFTQDNKYYNSFSISSATCKAIYGKWEGGHDPSGHTFLLTLGITVLVIESIELYTDDDNITVGIWNPQLNFFKTILHPSIVTLVVVFLELMMFLMTIIKYHSLAEQIAGFVVAISAVWSVDRILDTVIVKILDTYSL